MKNNSTRALPPRRTIGSIVRQSQNKDKEQYANASRSTNANSSKTSNNNDATNNIDPVCDICAQNVPGPEREKIYAFGKCDHHVCYVCSARLRAVCDQEECPICREKLEKVIFSANKTKPFDTYDLQSCLYDEKHGIYFENEKIRDAFRKLLNIQCLECLKRSEKSAFVKGNDKKQLDQDSEPKKQQDANSSSTYHDLSSINADRSQKVQLPTVQKLKIHLESAHKLRLCDLCLKHNKLFPFEYSYYNYESLRGHTQKGEPNTSHRGHPRCKLCNNIFFNLDDLLQHMSREHFHCHLCGRHNTTQHIYFIDYTSLRNHFKTKHFLCERDNCRHEQFTSAFDTQVDLQLHLVQVHDTSSNLTRGEARQHRTITLESVSHRQASHAQQDHLSANSAVITTGNLATANSPHRQIPASLQAQIRQQRLPSRSDFPALGNAHSSSMANSQNASTHISNSRQQTLHDGQGPSNSRVSFVRSAGGNGRPPEQLNDMDFPPLPEHPKKSKSGNKSKGTANKSLPPVRPMEMTLDQLISSSLTLSARNNRSNNRSSKTNKGAKHRPIKIQL